MLTQVPGKTKVTQFDNSILAYENVLGFHISVDHLMSHGGHMTIT